MDILPCRFGKYPPPANDTEVNNCSFIVYTKTSDIIELKNNDFELIYPRQKLRFSRDSEVNIPCEQLVSPTLPERDESARETNCSQG